MQQKTFDLNGLNGINGFTVPGVSTGNYLGWSVSTAGDINGDGVSDLVLGAVNANAAAGASYVIFGSWRGFASPFNLTNLNGSNGFIVPGAAAGDQLGISVSTAGDINGDGISDLVLGAYGVNSSAGAAYVVFGSRYGFESTFNLTNFNGSNGFIMPGIIINGGLGYSVSTAGDINGDGISDLVLGAIGVSASYVIFGSRSGFSASFNLANLNGINGFIVPSIALNSHLGSSVSMAGDINGDGIDDLVLGAYLGSSHSGTDASYVIFGSREGFATVFNLRNLNGTNGFTIPGIALSDGLGTSVSTAGDVNGDGLSDLVFGAPWTSNFGAGYVIFGSRDMFPASFNLTNLNGTNGFIMPGIASIADLGYAVNTAGDLNGDEVSDIVLGAISSNSGISTCCVIFGSRGGFAPSFNLANLNGTNGFIVPSIVLHTQLGNSVSTAGDINGDGISDLVLGDPLINLQAGASYVIFGKFPLIWVSNQMTITEGQRLLLTNAQLDVINLNNSTANLIFTVGSVQGGEFELVLNPGISITTFTQQQINNGQVYFVSDRTAPVSYSVSVTDGNFTLPSAPANVTFTNLPPIVINTPLTQVVELNQPFHFTLQANQIFNDSDGDPLTYFVKLSNGSSLPNWMSFDVFQLNQLDFSGTAPSIGGTQVSLFAQDPLNATANTQFELLAQLGNESVVNNIENVSFATIAGSVVGSLLGLGTLLGAGFGFWRYAANKNSRQGEHFANGIREVLKLKEVDNFDHETGQKYIAFVHQLQKSLQQVGIDPAVMRPGELRELANDLATAARNKITPATDCLGRSEITVTDLNDNLQTLVTEVQVLHSSGQQRGYAM